MLAFLLIMVILTHMGRTGIVMVTVLLSGLLRWAIMAIPMVEHTMMTTTDIHTGSTQRRNTTDTLMGATMMRIMGTHMAAMRRSIMVIHTASRWL
jgi:hypothetical protein